ncbi:homoserine O-acetyltransferase MetX [Polycladidibacter stylochi]|uniref:homoserine O-acetyltransferase MetX n=1 Tax=Polycladidibacter stylochi TaxID=1807766 RepID=UPI0009E727C2|nr:homoserine O-acetyltransferase [Pseudovibrio stylochi]
MTQPTKGSAEGAQHQSAQEQATHPVGKMMRFGLEDPLKLDAGVSIAPWQIAYETYGELNADKSNAVFVCHALTGDQYVASTNPVTGKPGWWSMMVGPGCPVDTNKYFVICSNVLGGCFGTTGPATHNPATGKSYGLDLPVVTIGDMVRAQRKLVLSLGIETLFAVIGGSMGGMQVLQWAAAYPEMVFSCVPIATAARHSSQNIAFHEVGRQAVMADPDWCHGNYAVENKRPTKGLSVARMAAHITYMSDASLHDKFGRNLQDRSSVSFGFDADFQIESYLRHQGMTFVDRFDANSYLYVTRAMDYFDLAAPHDGKLAGAFLHSKTRFCVMSFTTDWLFPTSESKAVVQALNAAAANVSFVEIDSSRGHDAFLLNEPEMFKTMRGFLTGAAKARGIEAPVKQSD